MCYCNVKGVFLIEKKCYVGVCGGCFVLVDDVLISGVIFEVCVWLLKGYGV